jgi:4-carboxymuconolactone decarboxylase
VRVASGQRALGLTMTIVAALGFGAARSGAAQPLPIENIQLRGDRFRGLHYREMTDEQRALLFNVVNSARAVTNTTGNGPFNVLLRTPQVGELSQQLGNSLRFSSGLPGRLRELATLMAGRAWTSAYEWYAHERYARDEGIDSAVIQAIAEHRRPVLATMPAEDAMVWRVTAELLYTRGVTDATYAEARAVLGEQRLFSLATIAAYYEYVSMLLNVDRYPLPVDASPAAAAATRALAILPADELYRAPAGSVTPRPMIPNEDAARAIAALGASVQRDAELPPDVRDVARSAVLLEWNRLVDRAVPRTAGATAAHRFTGELLRTRFVSDATFAAALDALGERGLVNLIVLMGHSNIRCAQQALAGSACAL